MSITNVINEKKKALLAYKEKILDDIKCTERSIDDIRANHKNKCFYDDHADSSDSEDDFTSAIDIGPSITQLKLQQAMMKTCLHATQELTGLMVLQSEVDVLVDEPKFEGERPVTEAGTWREVTVECRIDLVPFTMTFFMQTPDRRFAPPSYRGLRVVPVKSAHELELSKSVLHSLKVPSDAVEVLRSYAAGYRSRRTTLARLANKYTNSLFMEPHAEGGFVLKCANLLDVSWRLMNKWSPVAPFHHRMNFDLEFIEESYMKIITQAHKQLSDPTIQTDERTLLLAQIISTCLEVRGTIDPESDLESKTTERDNDTDKRDSESEKRDSEVMAPPKSFPKKGKQKNKDSLPNTAQKRSMDDEDGDYVAKKLKNDVPEAKKSIVDVNNTRKTKMNDVAKEGGKKKKMSEVNKVANTKNVKEAGNIEDRNVKSKETHNEDKTGNTKTIKESDNNAKIVKEVEDEVANTKSKPKNMKESAATDNKNTKTKNKVTKEAGDNAVKETNAKPKTKVLKEPAKIDSNAKPNTKVDKDIGKNQENDDNEKLTLKNTKDVQNKDSAAKNKVVKEPVNTEKVKNNVNKAKVKTTKETNNPEGINQNENIDKTKNIEKKQLKKVANTKSKENVDANKDAGRPKSNITEKTTNAVKNIEMNAKFDINPDAPKVKNVASTKKVANTKSKENVDANKDAGRPKSNITENTTNVVKNIETNAKFDINPDAPKGKNVASTKKVANTKSKENVDANKDPGRPKSNIMEKTTNAVKNIEMNAKFDINPDAPKVKNVASTKKVANTKSKENVDANKDPGRPKNNITENTTNAVKNIETNADKIDKNPDALKVKNVANTKKDNQTNKKAPVKNINVASTKNDDHAKKKPEKNIINKEKQPEVANKGLGKTIKEKTVNTNDKNDAQTVKKVTEKNATNIRNKDKISPITTVTEKIVKVIPAPIKDVPEKVINSNLITKKTKQKINNKNIIKKPIIHKIASHRNSLKPQNPPKVLKAGSIKTTTTGNTEKENGGKGTKIPQKLLTLSEGSSKKNLLRISPRKIPSKFKTTSQETFKQKMVKSTNIPRLLKKPTPKT